MRPPNLDRFAMFIALNRSEAVPESADTYLTGVSQILPGQTCTVSLDGQLQVATYWTPPTRLAERVLNPIDEYIGRVNSATTAASVAHMRSPSGWLEPGQTPEFDEFTVVLKGTVRVEYKTGSLDVLAGQAVIVPKGEWVRYSTPEADGGEYIAVCLPAFSMETVHRDG